MNWKTEKYTRLALERLAKLAMDGLTGYSVFRSITARHMGIRETDYQYRRACGACGGIFSSADDHST
jgi:hypothetical protein